MTHAEQIQRLRGEHYIDLTALCMYAEAAGEPMAGKLAVGLAIRNRAARPGWWGKSVQGVILQPKQFSAFNPSEKDRLIPRMIAALEGRNSSAAARRAFDDCHRAAALVFGGLFDFTEGADHYHTVLPPYEGVKEWPPRWAKKLRRTVTIDRHVFYTSLP